MCGDPPGEARGAPPPSPGTARARPRGCGTRAGGGASPATGPAGRGGPSPGRDGCRTHRGHRRCRTNPPRRAPPPGPPRRRARRGGPQPGHLAWRRRVRCSPRAATGRAPDASRRGGRRPEARWPSRGPGPGARSATVRTRTRPGARRRPRTRRAARPQRNGRRRRAGAPRARWPPGGCGRPPCAAGRRPAPSATTSAPAAPGSGVGPAAAATTTGNSGGTSTGGWLRPGSVSTIRPPPSAPSSSTHDGVSASRANSSRVRCSSTGRSVRPPAPARRGRRGATSRDGVPAASSSRSTRRSSLPVSLNGSSSRMSMRSGVLVERSCGRTNAAQLVLVDVARRRTSTTAATTSSPHSVSGMPTTARRLDGRVVEEHVLDLAGREVLAAAHDHVVEPAVHEQVARRRRGGRASRVCEPAVVEAVAAPEVLARHLLAAHPDLAARRRRRGLAVGRRGSTPRRLGQRPARPSPAGPARRDRRWRTPRGGRRGRAAAIVLDVSVRP